MGEELCVLPGWRPNQTYQVVFQLLLAEEEQEAVYKIPTFILLSTLMVVGLPGNVLVLLVYGFRFPASTTKCFIMAMAIFDLLNCVVGMPFEMVDLRYDMEFNIPVPCKIIRFWITLSTCGSVSVLLAVSIDRYRRICRAFHKQMSVRQTKFLIAILTLVSVIFALPALILYGRQTEIRYDIPLYDCSIDDTYKSGTPAAAYQYILGGTWVVSIVILSIMYGFIIYKINLQKKRRERLSNQSYDSMVFNRLKKLSIETHSNDRNKDIHRPNVDTSLFIKKEPNVETSERQQSSEANVCQCELTNGVPPEGRNNNFMSRLFSRDVNPIFEFTDDNGEVNDANLYGSDEENASLPGPFDSARLIRYARTSLNNYLGSSQETELANRSTSFIQTVTPKEAEGVNLNNENLQNPSRKCDHSLVKHKSWESDKLMYEFCLINPVLERAWTSENGEVPAGTRVIDYDFLGGIRRTLSQNNLERSARDPSDLHVGKGEWLHIEQSHGVGYEAEDASKLFKDLKPSGRECSHENCVGVTQLSVLLTNLSQDSVPIDATSDCQMNNSMGEDSYKVNNSFHDSHKTNISLVGDMHQTNDSLAGKTNLCSSDCPKTKEQPIRKYRATSIVDAIKAHMSKKRSTAREIKTSRVSFMMLMVTAGFVLSYLPHLGIQIFKSLYPTLVARLLCTSQAYFVMHHLLIRFFFINNAINPIIYSFYNKTFRDRCLRLLKSPRSLLQSSDHYISNVHSISQDNDTS